MRIITTHGSFLEAQKYEFILKDYLASGSIWNFTSLLLTGLPVRG
ncbi:hypothetical protein [Mucilaginibacter psychrotolerans]|nr:hypothetical protein [Mucilaginibacter psychrotolerans]